MKRICALLLAFVMMFTTVACGIPQTEENSQPPEVITTPAPEAEDGCTVSFDYNFGDKGVYLISEVEKGGKVVKPVDPERDGYIFAGWFTKEKDGANSILTPKLQKTSPFMQNGRLTARQTSQPQAAALQVPPLRQHLFPKVEQQHREQVPLLIPEFITL